MTLFLTFSSEGACLSADRPVCPAYRQGGAFGGKMIVAQQKFLSEIFAEHPKFCILIFAF